MHALARIHTLAFTLALATCGACSDATTDAAAPSHDSTNTSLQSKATGDAKAELERVIHKLDTKRKMISERLATWKHEGTQTWQAFTADLDRMAKEIQTTAKDALANDEEEGDEDK